MRFARDRHGNETITEESTRHQWLSDTPEIHRQCRPRCRRIDGTRDRRLRRRRRRSGQGQTEDPARRTPRSATPGGSRWRTPTEPRSCPALPLPGVRGGLQRQQQHVRSGPAALKPHRRKGRCDRHRRRPSDGLDGWSARLSTAASWSSRSTTSSPSRARAGQHRSVRVGARARAVARAPARR